MEEIKGTITAEATINGEVATERAIEGRLDVAGIGGGGAVDDVQINGTSIVVDNVANIPIASHSTLGLVKTDNSSGGYTTGFFQLADGQLYVNTATNDDIDRRRLRKEIDSSNLDYAVKCAMCDGVGPSWSTSEQENARTRLGVPLQDHISKISIGSTFTNFELVPDNVTILSQIGNMMFLNISVKAKADAGRKDFDGILIINDRSITPRKNCVGVAVNSTKRTSGFCYIRGAGTIVVRLNDNVSAGDEIIIQLYWVIG